MRADRSSRYFIANQPARPSPKAQTKKHRTEVAEPDMTRMSSQIHIIVINLEIFKVELGDKLRRHLGLSCHKPALEVRHIRDHIGVRQGKWAEIETFGLLARRAEIRSGVPARWNLRKLAEPPCWAFGPQGAMAPLRRCGRQATSGPPTRGNDRTAARPCGQHSAPRRNHRRAWPSGPIPETCRSGPEALPAR